VRLDVANPMQGSTSTDAGRRWLRTRRSDSAVVARFGERARGKEKGEEANQGHHWVPCAMEKLGQVFLSTEM
jgi:hypothetical protein